MKGGPDLLQRIIAELPHNGIALEHLLVYADKRMRKCCARRSLLVEEDACEEYENDDDEEKTEKAPIRHPDRSRHLE
jgi:hypothetical protein